MSEELEYYKILGVPRNATTAEIRLAYKRLALEVHPDKNPDDKDATKRFQDLAEAYTVLKDEDKRRRYDNGTLNDDFYYPEEDEEIRRFGHHAHSFHDFFGFLFARMFARHGRGAFMVDPDDDGDDTYDSAEEDDLTDDEDDDEDDDDDDETDQYYDADPNWRSANSRGAPSNYPQGAHQHHHHPHSSDPAFASRLPTSATPDPRELSPPDQLKRPKVTLQKADLIVTWGYNNGPRKPVDTFILEMKRDGPVAPSDKTNPHQITWQVIYTGQKQSVKVSGLDAGCIYKFRVKAGNGAGESPASAETSITTPKAAQTLPQPPQPSQPGPPASTANQIASSQQKAAVKQPTPAPSSARVPQAQPPAKHAGPNLQAASPASAKQPTRPAVTQPAQGSPAAASSQSSPTPQSPAPAAAPAAPVKRPPAPAPVGNNFAPPQPPKASAPKKSPEQLALEKKAAEMQVKASKLAGELDAAISKKSKSQIESIFASAKKAGIKLPPGKVEAANAALKEVQAQQERDRALNVLRQKLQQAIATKSLVEVKEAIKEAESFSGKGLQQQILEAHQLLEELEKDADVQRRLEDAIKAKDAKLLEKLINEAKAAGIPIKDAKKVLRGLVKGREVQDQISKALADNDIDGLVDVLLQHKDRPPRDQDAISQMELAVKRVTDQLMVGIEQAIRSRDPETARASLAKAALLSIDLKTGMSAQQRQQLEALELDEIRNSLRAALRAPPLDRANLLQATLDRAATSPHSAKLQADIDSAIQELERLGAEESVRFQLHEAVASGAKDKLLTAIQAASPMSTSLQKELDQAKQELDRILDLEERRSSRPIAGPARPVLKDSTPTTKVPPKQPALPIPASSAKTTPAKPDEPKTRPLPAKATAAAAPFPAYAKAASANSPSKLSQPITILTNKDREEFPPLGVKGGSSDAKSTAFSAVSKSELHASNSVHVASSADPISILQPRRKQPDAVDPKGPAGVPALATASPAPKLAQSDPTLALFQALLGGAPPAAPSATSFPPPESHFLGSVFGSASNSSWLSGSGEDPMGESLSGVESSYVPTGLQTGDWAYQPPQSESTQSKPEQSVYSVFGNPHPLHQLGGGWSPLAPSLPQPLGPLAVGPSASIVGDSAWSPINLAVPGLGGFPDFAGGWYSNAFGSAPPAAALPGQPPARDPFQ